MKQAFMNGNVITMDGQKICQSFAVENGRFSEVGEPEEKVECKADEIVDLHGKTVLPAFIDAHSHLSSYANSFLQAQLGETACFDDILDVLQTFAKKTGVQDGGWIIGAGYDHNGLKERAHPTKSWLDTAFPNVAVVLQHKSGHFGVFNTMALRKAGLEGKDKDGYLEENAFVAALKTVPLPQSGQMLPAYKKALDSYASYGITTVQEGMMVSQMLPLYQMLLNSNTLSLDVVGYPQIADEEIFYETFPECADGYHAHFRLGGYKIILDGSPQGRTAWMKTPYKGGEGCFGVSSMTDEEVSNAVKKAVSDGRQLLAHCNGDAAAEQYIASAEKSSSPEEFKKIRPVIVHGQLLAKNQLPRVKKLGMIPSFFVAHCYHWGDVHIENFGFERAAEISPTKSAQENGILFTFHQDTPVIEPNMFETVWCAVTRKTRKGILLGADERISVYEALKAVTINAAYQYSENDQKGSIASGKKADFILISEDPFAVPPERLREISVLQTFESGRSIYRKKD